jgi:hypothetical protein
MYYLLSDTVTASPRSSSERFSSELFRIEKQPNSSELLMTPKDEEKRPTFVLSILDQQGYWIGNTWVPPKGWKLYSPEEMQNIYGKTRGIMWIGDSSARRTAATMYGILNATNSSNNAIPLKDLDASRIIDVNKNRTTEPCTKYDDPFRPYVCREMPGQL